MNDYLKGNFQVKRPVVEKTEDQKSDAQKVAELLKERALNNLGGSMVYVERTQLVWDGNDGEQGGEPSKS